jgi:hypothetical protein
MTSTTNTANTPTAVYPSGLPIHATWPHVALDSAFSALLTRKDVWMVTVSDDSRVGLRLLLMGLANPAGVLQSACT